MMLTPELSQSTHALTLQPRHVNPDAQQVGLKWTSTLVFEVSNCEKGFYLNASHQYF